MKTWKLYLSGEIHTDWREQIEAGCKAAKLPVSIDAPVTHHEASDDCGVAILGEEPNKFWHDHKGAQINAIRTRTLIGEADVVVVRFGEKYKQWNAAFDAGYAAALGKPLIVMHGPDHQHALKEVDAAALAVAQTADEIVEIPPLRDQGRVEGLHRVAVNNIMLGTGPRMTIERIRFPVQPPASQYRGGKNRYPIQWHQPLHRRQQFEPR